jgi:hypothetical protein
MIDYSRMILNTDGISSIIGGVPLIVLLAVAVGLLVVHGLALYHAARNQSKGWFWIIVLLDPLSILSIIYLIMNKRK